MHVICPLQWPGNWSGRLLLDVNGRTKRLFNAVLRFAADCSLQVTADLKSRPSLSYHPTGLVTFKVDGRKPVMVMEPLFGITTSNDVLLASIPNCADLDDYGHEPGAKDVVLPWPANERLTLAISLMPASAAQSHEASMFMSLPTPIFDLCFLHAEHPPRPSNQPSICFLKPDKNPGRPLTISEEEAYVRVRHAMLGPAEVLVVGPNGAGEYELTFPASFARRPTGLINPADGKLMIDVVWYERHHLRFRVTDRHRNLVRDTVLFTVGGREGDSSQWWPIPTDRYLGARYAKKVPAEY